MYLIILGFLLAVTGGAIPQVVITEVNSTANGYASYIEVQNVGSGWVDISDYTLTYGNDGTDRVVDESLSADGYASGLGLSPGEFFLILRSQTTFSQIYPHVPLNTGEDDTANELIEFMMHGNIYLNGGEDYLILKDETGRTVDAFNRPDISWLDNHCFERSGYPNDGTDLLCHWTDLGVDQAGTPAQVNDTSLPVRLLSFSVHLQDGRICLEWRTESEFDLYGFVIHRRIDPALERETISPVIQPRGDATSGAVYRFIDEGVDPESQAWYELEQLELDGESQWYGPIHFVCPELETGLHVPEEFQLSAYPNPFTPVTRLAVQIGGDRPKDVRLLVCDLLGRRVRLLAQQSLDPGSHTFFWNGETERGESAVAGVYFCQLYDDRKIHSTVRLIKFR